MSYRDYTPQQRLAHEVRILLTLIEAEEEVGPDLTGVFQYQRDKIYDLINGIGDVAKAEMELARLRSINKEMTGIWAKKNGEA